MNIKQVFTYLEVNLLPDKGGRIQFITEEKKEILRIFIFDEKFFNFKYIFSFVKEFVDGEYTFKCFIKSGFSGIDHELKLPLTDEMFQGIKDGLHNLDGMYMRNLESEISDTDYVETTDAEEVPPNTTIPPEQKTKNAK